MTNQRSPILHTFALAALAFLIAFQTLWPAFPVSSPISRAETPTPSVTPTPTPTPVPPSGLAPAQWPMFRHDLQHTGRSPYPGLPASELKWSLNLGTPISSSPALAPDGTLLVTGQNNQVYSINPNGTFNVSKLMPTSPIIDISPAVAADGTIYIGSTNNNLYALRSNFSTKWNYTTGGPIYTSPAVWTDGTVYIASDKLYAVNSNGTLKWSYTTPGSINFSPVVAPDGTIYVASDKVYAVNPDGTPKWNYATQAASGAIGADGTVYLAVPGGLTAVRSDGTLKWSVVAGFVSITTSVAIAHDGTLYVGGFYGNILAGPPTWMGLYAYDPATGAQKWTITTANQILSSPAVAADGTIYFGSDDGTLRAYNSDSTPRWSYTTGGAVKSSPAIGADGTVYFGSSDGHLYALGGPAAPTPTPGPSPTAIPTPTPGPTPLPTPTPTPFPGLAGDVNHDGVVNTTDLNLLTASFNKRTGDAGFNSNADFNGDGIVDIYDLVRLGLNFGRTAP